MKRLLTAIAFLFSATCFAQIPALNDTTLYTGSTAFTPQFRYKQVTLSGVSYRIPQIYNPLLAKYDSYVTTKYLSAFYAPLVSGGYALINGGNTFTGDQIITDGSNGLRLHIDPVSGAGIWATGITPDNTNYGLVTSGGNTRINGGTSLNFGVGGSSSMVLTSGLGLIVGYPARFTSVGAGSTSDRIGMLDPSTGVLKYVAGNTYEVPLTFGNGLTRTSNTVKLDTSIAATKANSMTLAQLRSNYIQNQLATKQSASFRLSGTGQLNRANIGYYTSTLFADTTRAFVVTRTGPGTDDLPLIWSDAGRLNKMYFGAAHGNAIGGNYASWLYMGNAIPGVGGYDFIRSTVRSDSTNAGTRNDQVNITAGRWSGSTRNSLNLLDVQSAAPGLYLSQYAYDINNDRFDPSTMHSYFSVLTDGTLTTDGTVNSAGLNAFGASVGLPPTSGTTQNSKLRLGSTAGGETGVLDAGTASGGVSWLQATDRTDLSQKYTFAINPNGGIVTIGGTGSPFKVDASGNATAASVVTAAGASLAAAPQVVATYQLAGKTNVGSLISYTPPADGYYMIQGVFFVNSLTTNSIRTRIEYTVPSGTAVSIPGTTILAATLSTSQGTAIQNFTFAKGGVPINVTMENVAIGGTQNYDVSVRVTSFN